MREVFFVGAASASHSRMAMSSSCEIGQPLRRDEPIERVSVDEIHRQKLVPPGSFDRLRQAPVLLHRRQHPIDRHRGDAQVVRPGHRLGSEQGVRDRRLGRLRRGLEQWRDAIIR